MKREEINIGKNDKKKYVGLSVKVIEIHLSDCINSSSNPAYINEGGIDNRNFTGGANFSSWGYPTTQE